MKLLKNIGLAFIILSINILDNYFFELEHYGAILNANRSYHLSRSQPPFLTSTILAIYEEKNKVKKVDTAWLAK